MGCDTFSSLEVSFPGSMLPLLICFSRECLEIDPDETSLFFSQFFLLPALMKQTSFCLCFRRKATLSKKVYIFFQYLTHFWLMFPFYTP